MLTGSRGITSGGRPRKKVRSQATKRVNHDTRARYLIPTGGGTASKLGNQQHSLARDDPTIRARYHERDATPNPSSPDERRSRVNLDALPYTSFIVLVEFCVGSLLVCVIADWRGTVEASFTKFCAGMVAVGAAVLNEAKAKGAGHEIPTDWFLESVHP